LDKPDILIETDKGGRSNLEFDTQKKADAKAEKEKSAEDKGSWIKLKAYLKRNSAAL
jgi:hypothetical protein